MHCCAKLRALRARTVNCKDVTIINASRAAGVIDTGRAGGRTSRADLLGVVYVGRTSTSVRSGELEAASLVLEQSFNTVVAQLALAERTFEVARTCAVLAVGVALETSV